MSCVRCGGVCWTRNGGLCRRCDPRTESERIRAKLEADQQAVDQLRRPPAAARRRKTIVVDGQTYEVVWDGEK